MQLIGAWAREPGKTLAKAGYLPVEAFVFYPDAWAAIKKQGKSGDRNSLHAQMTVSGTISTLSSVGVTPKEFIDNCAILAGDLRGIANNADIVGKMYYLRKMTEIGFWLNKAAKDNRTDPEKLQEQFFKKSREIKSVLNQGGGVVPLEMLVEEFEDNLRHQWDIRNSGETIQNTGIKGLDDLLVAFTPGYYLVGGRPSMGKTSLALSIMFNFLLNKKAVLMFSLEMTGIQLLSRLSQYAFGLGSSAFINPLSEWKTPDELNAWIKGARGIRNNKLFIDPSSGINTDYVMAVAEEHQGVDLVVIDYLQLMRSPAIRLGEVAAMNQISQAIAGLHKTMNAPVLALSQLSRDVEKRSDKRPLMSDLRQSGSLEQDADAIIFPFRPRYYFESEPKDLIELAVVKNRQYGRTGMEIANYDPKTGRIS